MDYSKLNNIAASIQDVENATSIVENRLNTKIDEDIQSIQDAISDIGSNPPSEQIDDNVISAALNDLNDKMDNLNKDVENLERVTSSSLNDLDEKIDDLSDKTDNLTKDVEDLEKTTSSSLNDLNEKVDDLTDKIDDNELITALADLDDKIKYEIKTTNNITNPTKNTYYDLTSLNLTSLDLTSISLTNINEVVVKFTTDSTITCTISAPANVKFIGNSALYKGTTYVLAMLYGVICICEAPSLT